MPFLLAEILNFQGSIHRIGVGSFSYLVFGFEEVAEVCLNDDESQNNLKSIFVKLLTEITKYPIELQFLEKPEYKTGLYIDVCKEYIKDLNKEITNVRKNMPEKLKIQ